MLTQADINILRPLAAQVAEIAALPVQAEKRRLWVELNGLRRTRPLVMIDQLPWNELNVDDELTLRCADPECRGYEETLRRSLFQWRHFPVDLVVEDFIRIPKAIFNTGFGVDVQEAVVATDPQNDVVSHGYRQQFKSMADLDKLKVPHIHHDTVETARRLAVAHEIFDGLLTVRPWGYESYLSIWDPVTTWMGMGNVLLALKDQPQLLHGLAERLLKGYLCQLDQLEAAGLLCQPQSLIHCTGAFTDELPKPGYDPAHVRTQDIWMFGLAQLFAVVSPRMFQEFEIDYTRHICDRFGLVYYGCCDPLDGKMEQVRRLPNVRKVSMSPSANQERGAANIGRDYVFSRKPNPAFLAYDDWDADAVRADLEATRDTCARHDCPLEIILKDVSTVRYEPQRLFEWARIAMQVVGA
ncbi:MAG: hypothetical protein IT317_16760 [Anaerolineales bacterium]|nr:hypothetical protein [Anaerolineales bacterium]